MWRGLTLALVILAGVTGAAQAQRVAIRTGEHEGFTRLVLTLPQAGNWRVMRTEQGYAVAIGTGRPDYDLSEVFRLIPRTRLADIRTDTETGRLNLTIACQCHAWPVELRRGLLVIDLRDGPPPAASPHEVDAAGRRVAALHSPTQPRPEQPALPGAVGYDWRNAALAAAAARTTPPLQPAPPAAAAPDGTARPVPGDWRDGLIAELGRAATRGVIELAPVPPRPAGPVAQVPPAMLPQVRIGDGPLPVGRPDAPDPGLMTAQGNPCIPDAALDLSSWGDPAPVAQMIGPLTRAVSGEFDRPDLAAIERGTQYLLYLGFGAEARQLLALAGGEGSDRPTERALSHILDGTEPPDADAAFSGMAGCDTAAALWSVLSRPSGMAPARLREDAVLRAFSALPLHLRRHLGPGLADRLLSAGLTDAARAVRDAILRAPGDAGAAVALMSVGIDQATGTPTSAQNLEGLRNAPGDAGLRATILSLEAEVAAGRVPALALLTAAEALLREYRGTAEAAALARSLAAAQAAAGDFPRALDLAGTDPGARATIWSLLASRGGDADILTHAVRRATDLPPDLPQDINRALARRLISQGFPDEAILWLSPERQPQRAQEAEDRLLTAEAFLASRDARGALAALSGADSAPARALRLRALTMLKATDVLPDDMPTSDRAVLARHTGQWDIVAATDQAPWRDAAALLSLPEMAEGGTLARGRALRDESAAARTVIQGLLQVSRLPERP